MNNDLVERYIYAVTKKLPFKQRADVEAELRSIISDMLDARCGAVKPSDTDVRVVLAELGTPDELATKYMSDGERYLIGPAYYHKYKLLTTLVMACVAGGLTIAQFILAVLEPGEPWYHYISQWFTMLVTAELGVFAWMTIIFVQFDRKKITFDMNSLGNLPPVPKKNEKISLAESVVGIVFSILFAIIFLAIPGIFGIPGGEKLLDTQVVRSVWWLVALLTLAGIAKECLKIAEGRYTRRLAAGLVVLNVATAFLTLLLAFTPGLFNPGFPYALERLAGDGGDFLRKMFQFFFPYFFFGMVVLSHIIDTVTILYRAFKYDH